MKVFESDSNSGRWMHASSELGFHVDFVEHKVIKYLANFCEVNTNSNFSELVPHGRRAPPATGSDQVPPGHPQHHRAGRGETEATETVGGTECGQDRGDAGQATEGRQQPLSHGGLGSLQGPLQQESLAQVIGKQHEEEIRRRRLRKHGNACNLLPYDLHLMTKSQTQNFI